MTHTTRQLAIMANTVELHLTAEEQRIAWSYLAGIYEQPCPYRAKGCKQAYKTGLNIAARYPKSTGPQRSDYIRRANGLSDQISERHPELDQ